ncbi:MAG TPA: hypothetical protein VNT22_08970 [Baekduia sp.]|nr:hypothetical protein [Baekduia sp.]
MAACAALLALPAGAQAAKATPGSGPVDPNALSRPDRLDRKPLQHALTGAEARAIADRVPRIAALRERYRASYRTVFLKGQTRWQVSYYLRQKGEPVKEIGQVLIDDGSGAVLEAWTGDQVAWTMARGYPGAFGRKVNSPWVWLGLTALFLVPFAARRPRMLHLDLAVFAAFGISLAYFNDGQIDKSVPLVYPLLVYLLLRAAWIGLRTSEDEPRRRLPLIVPVSWLAIALVFLIGFRIGLNVTNSNVIDVGYAGVIGADKIVKGQPIYGAFPADNPQGDTYGPVNYEAYIPFEQLLPWTGKWDDLKAARGAAITFDLICIALLFYIGRRVRGPGIGIILAYLWAACPFSVYAMNTGANDSLVAVFALAALAVSAAPARGAIAAAGGLTKFGSLALVPLLAFDSRRPRNIVAFGLAFVGAAVLLSLPIFIEHESLRTVYDKTIGYQASRESPFSIWGRYGWDSAQTLWQILAVVGALVVAVMPRRRDLIGLAALMAAILISLQLGVSHWFYLYIVWFTGLMFVALICRHQLAEPESQAKRERSDRELTFAN